MIIVVSCIFLLTVLKPFLFRVDFSMVNVVNQNEETPPVQSAGRSKSRQEYFVQYTEDIMQQSDSHYSIENVTSHIPYAENYHAILNSGQVEYWGQCYKYRRQSQRKFLPDYVLKRNKCEQRLPKAFIVGTKKCGTMTLCQYLGIHPAVSIRCEVQDMLEPGFREGLAFASPRQLQMAEKPGTICQSSERLRLLRDDFLDRDPKFINIIRDPIQRAVSDYLHKIKVVARELNQDPLNLSFPVTYKHDNLHETFERTVTDNPSYKHVNTSQMTVKFGMYSECTETFLSVFKREQLLILDGQAFADDPFRTMRAVEEFLGLPPFFRRQHFKRNPKTGFFCARVPERPDKGCADPTRKGRPHPAVDKDVRALLYDFYRPYNLKLAKEFDLDFPWLFL